MAGDVDGTSGETYPSQDVPSKSITRHLAVCIFACVIGTSFQFGYSSGVINSPGEYIQDFINQTHISRHGVPTSDRDVTLLYSIIVAVWAVGGMIGGFAAGPLMDQCGRRGGMLLNNIGFILGALLTMFAPRSKSYEMMIIGRLFTGISCGIATGLAPVYLSEIAPVALRGGIGTIHQVTIVFSIFLAQIFGLTQLLGSAPLWPYLFGIPLIPVSLQLIMLPFCPESPEYLFIHKNAPSMAARALGYLRGSRASLDAELHEMRQAQEHQANARTVTVCGLFENAYLRRALGIAVLMQLSQQLSGINGVTYYSDGLFMSLGFSDDKARYSTLGIVGILLVFTLLSVFLVDIAGRRFLHLLGLGGMAVFALLLTIGFSLKDKWSNSEYLDIVSACGYVISFAIGPGSIPWFIVAELFAQNARSAAMSLAVFVNWLANFAVAQSFPFLQEYLGSYVFLPFMVLLIIFFLLTYFFVPETKGKTIEEIQRDLRASDEQEGTYTNLDDTGTDGDS